jgi:uncharacterized protein (TIGR03000 family)
VAVSDPPERPSETAAANQATVIVRLPADAQLYVDDQLAPLSSATRSFVTPALELDRTYHYTLEVRAQRNGRTVTQSRRVDLRAGRVTRANFGDLSGPADVAYESAPAPAHITVRLPEQGRLFVDDVACPQTSSRTAFDTPKLEAGKEYHYTLRVEVGQGGQSRTDSRRITFQAGTEVKVDFSDLPAVAGR